MIRPTDALIVFGQLAFGTWGSWKEQCQNFELVERHSGCPGEGARFSQESAGFSLGCEAEYRVSEDANGRQRTGLWCSWCGHSTEISGATYLTSVRSIVCEEEAALYNGSATKETLFK